MVQIPVAAVNANGPALQQAASVTVAGAKSRRGAVNYTTDDPSRRTLYTLSGYVKTATARKITIAAGTKSVVKSPPR